MVITDRTRSKIKCAQNLLSQEQMINVQINNFRRRSHKNQHKLLIDKHPKKYEEKDVYFIDVSCVQKRAYELMLWDAMWNAALKNKQNKVLEINLLSIAESLHKRSETLLHLDYFNFYPDLNDMASDEEKDEVDLKKLTRTRTIRKITNSFKTKDGFTNENSSADDSANPAPKASQEQDVFVDMFCRSYKSNEL
jgi:hypothetical protein